jgi:hypothetical protein
MKDSSNSSANKHTKNAGGTFEPGPSSLIFSTNAESLSDINSPAPQATDYMCQYLESDTAHILTSQESDNRNDAADGTLQWRSQIFRDRVAKLRVSPSIEWRKSCTLEHFRKQYNFRVTKTPVRRKKSRRKESLIRLAMHNIKKIMKSARKRNRVGSISENSVESPPSVSPPEEVERSSVEDTDAEIQVERAGNVENTEPLSSAEEVKLSLAT